MIMSGNRAICLGWSVAMFFAIIADARGVDPLYSVPILFLLGAAIALLAVSK
jgi:hypothetical protein